MSPPIRGSILEGKSRDPGLTSIRNTTLPHWRAWLAPAHRCLVPPTSFADAVPEARRKSEQGWFALREDRARAAFAGMPRWPALRMVRE